MAQQVWKYLAGTQEAGLVFPKEEEIPHIEVCTDASFGEISSHGRVMVRWGRAPVLWKSSKQTVMATSTAGAELLEIMEGAAMADAIRVVAEELRGELPFSTYHCVWRVLELANEAFAPLGQISSLARPSRGCGDETSPGSGYDRGFGHQSPYREPV